MSPTWFCPSWRQNTSSCTKLASPRLVDRPFVLHCVCIWMIFLYDFSIKKVFLREMLDQYLEQQLLQITRKSALIIQKNLRMFIARNKYLRLRSSVILIQSYIRTWIKRFIEFNSFIKSFICPLKFNLFGLSSHRK